MGNIFPELKKRLSDSWKAEGLSSTLTAIAVFLVGRDLVALWRSLLAAVLVMTGWALYHSGCILWGIRCITGLHQNDPVIVASFIDERKEPIPVQRTASLELKNKGKSKAQWVQIAPLRLRNRILHFPHITESINPTDYRRFYAEVGDQWGYDSTHDLIRAMSEEWSSLGDQTIREVTVPMRVDYADEFGVRFEAHFEMLYHGGKGWNQPADFKCIECRNFTYRRIISGGALPLPRESLLVLGPNPPTPQAPTARHIPAQGVALGHATPIPQRAVSPT
jgi:hypothetical protein